MENWRWLLIFRAHTLVVLCTFLHLKWKRERKKCSFCQKRISFCPNDNRPVCHTRGEKCRFMWHKKEIINSKSPETDGDDDDNEKWRKTTQKFCCCVCVIYFCWNKGGIKEKFISKEESTRNEAKTKEEEIKSQNQSEVCWSVQNKWIASFISFIETAHFFFLRQARSDHRDGTFSTRCARIKNCFQLCAQATTSMEYNCLIRTGIWTRVRVCAANDDEDDEEEEAEFYSANAK